MTRLLAAGLLLLYWTAGAASAQPTLRDDFNGAQLGPLWLSLPPAYVSGWSVRNGKAFNPIDGGDETLVTAQAYTSPSYVIETKAASFGHVYFRQFGIIFGKPVPRLDFGYILQYSATEPRPFLTLGVMTGEGTEIYPVVLDVTSVTLDEEKFYTFRIERSAGGHLKVFINDGSGYGDQPVLEAVDQTYPTLGHFGWWTSTETFGEAFEVDWIEARTPGEPAPPLLSNVRASTGTPPAVGRLLWGSPIYTDRPYVVGHFPPTYLNGAEYIRPANNSKKATRPDYLSFQLTQPAQLYVCYDPRATVLPAWLSDWKKLEWEWLHTTDTGTTILHVYTKPYAAGAVTLGGNLAAPARGARSHYLVAAVPVPQETVWEAEKAALAGAVVATNHPGYSGTGFADYRNRSGDSITWTVTVPAMGYYRLSFGYALAYGTRTLAVTAGGRVAAPALTFPATGSWQAWDRQSLSVLLYSGINTITLKARRSSGPNLDYLAIAPDVTSPSVARLAGDESAAAPEVAREGTFSYPNPAGGYATIRYTLREAGPVDVALYDAQGRKVTTLAAGRWQEAGSHETTLNAASLPNGLYFYRIGTGRRQLTGKLLVQH